MEGRQRERGLSWEVVSCHDAEMCFWTWAIFQRGKRGSSGQPPPLTPSLRGDVSSFSENQRGPKYVRGSSNKIYRWGHKTPFMRGGKEMCCRSCHTDQTKHLCPHQSEVLMPGGGLIIEKITLFNTGASRTWSSYCSTCFQITLNDWILPQKCGSVSWNMLLQQIFNADD